MTAHLQLFWTIFTQARAPTSAGFRVHALSDTIGLIAAWLPRLVAVVFAVVLKRATYLVVVL